VGSGHKGEDGKEDVDFIPIVTYRQQAENCGKYLHKGSPVGVTGRLSVRPFTDREGNKRYITEVVADRVKFLSGGSGRQREPGEEDEGYTPPANMHEIEEDLPF
jgi:single-strand DNA-binding protein